jgi:hypothetical protein
MIKVIDKNAINIYINVNFKLILAKILNYYL